MRRFAKVLLGVGVLVCIVAIAWRPVVVPRVVKLPSNVDRTDSYAGTFVTFVDRATGATLTTPKSAPLTIDRHVQSVGDQTGSSVAVLKETLTAKMGDQTQVEENQYTVDRRTMQNVADPRAWAFSPANLVDRSGSYYVTLPMSLGSSGVTLNIWKPEAAATYPLTSTTPATGTLNGTGVVNLKGNIPTPLPVAPYELSALEAQGLPVQLTPDQVTAQLTAAGIDVAAAAPVLAAHLTSAELATVTGAIGQPVPLAYSVYGNGLVAAEPTTGGLVQLSQIVDGIAVKPDLGALGPVVTVLQAHADVPEIASLLTSLQAVSSAPPTPVFELRYTQTPASVASAAAYTSDQADKVRLAQSTIPNLLLAGGLLLVVLGGLGLWRTRRREEELPVDLTDPAGVPRAVPV